MSVAKVLLGFLLSAPLCGASQMLLDLNPDLGPFQDESQCFPKEETWHLLYRNFQEDPNLGGKSKCVTATQTGVLIGDSTYVYFEYPPGHKLNTTLELMSSPGYTAKNVLNFTPMSDPDRSMNITISYRACHSCTVVRHGYINNGGCGPTFLLSGDRYCVCTDAWRHRGFDNNLYGVACSCIKCYDRKGAGCSMWVAKHERHVPHPCCDYVFGVLCGFKPAYKMLDESCL